MIINLRLNLCYDVGVPFADLKDIFFPEKTIISLRSLKRFQG